MKIYKYGIFIGVLLGILIVLGNVVFPNNEPDYAPGELLVLLLIGTYVILSAAYAGKKAKNKSVALKVGVITSLFGFLLSMMTFIVIDNLFLDIVSRQADKIVAFQNSHYSSMRELINWRLLRGILVGTPASVVFGAVCGIVGSKLSRRG